MDFHAMSRRAGRFSVPHGFTSWPAYWAEMALFVVCFITGMTVVTISLIEKVTT